MHKLVFPEVVGGVLDELNEGDEQAPGVRSVHNQSLQQDPDREGHTSEHHYVCVLSNPDTFTYLQRTNWWSLAPPLHNFMCELT